MAALPYAADLTPMSRHEVSPVKDRRASIAPGVGVAEVVRQGLYPRHQLAGATATAVDSGSSLGEYLSGERLLLFQRGGRILLRLSLLQGCVIYCLCPDPCLCQLFCGDEVAAEVLLPAGDIAQPRPLQFGGGVYVFDCTCGLRTCAAAACCTCQCLQRLNGPSGVTSLIVSLLVCNSRTVSVVLDMPRPTWQKQHPPTVCCAERLLDVLI